jgi:hypothetical protein
MRKNLTKDEGRRSSSATLLRAGTKRTSERKRETTESCVTERVIEFPIVHRLRLAVRATTPRTSTSTASKRIRDVLAGPADMRGSKADLSFFFPSTPTRRANAGGKSRRLRPVARSSLELPGLDELRPMCVFIHER